jgi:hypothetical protein
MLIALDEFYNCEGVPITGTGYELLNFSVADQGPSLGNDAISIMST